MKESRFTTGPFKASDFPLIVDDLVPPRKTMPVFIELHDIDASEQKPILINVDCIQTVEQDSHSDNAVIYMAKGGSIPVTETYEEVRAMLGKWGTDD